MASWWQTRREAVLDLLTGAALALALSLLLARSDFGLSQGDTVLIFYGKF